MDLHLDPFGTRLNALAAHGLDHGLVPHVLHERILDRTNIVLELPAVVAAAAALQLLFHWEILRLKKMRQHVIEA
jgi:hypothetical protein